MCVFEIKRKEKRRTSQELQLQSLNLPPTAASVISVQKLINNQHPLLDELWHRAGNVQFFDKINVQYI